MLSVYFDMCGSFISNQAFSYGLYLDGSSIGMGPRTLTRYIQTTPSSNAVGFSTGTNGMSAFAPLTIPVFVPSVSTSLQIGLANATNPLYVTTTIAPMVSSNVTSNSGTSNTSDFMPQNTFTTGGSNTYTVPSTVSGGSVVGVYMYVWGGGGNTYDTGAGGGGGFVSAFYSCSPGTVLTTVVGSNVGGGSGVIDRGGAGAGFFGPAGGFSAVFLSNAGGLVQSNVLILGGGGGSGGGGTAGASVAGGSGGGGGYPAGAAGLSNYTASLINGGGGTQSAGGIVGTGGGANPGGALFGGSAGFAAGGGGGGYYGGGGAGDNQGAGGGGSSFYAAGLTSVVTSNGVTVSTNQGGIAANRLAALPGGSTSSLYISPAGRGDARTGMVVIIPAVGAVGTTIGVDARMLPV
jgi:hypothetical protein